MFINALTNEYPRFASDVAQNRGSFWEIVEPTVPPKPGPNEAVVEMPPVKDERGIFRQVWSVVPVEETSLEERSKVFAERRNRYGK